MINLIMSSSSIKTVYYSFYKLMFITIGKNYLNYYKIFKFQVIIMLGREVLNNKNNLTIFNNY